MVQVAQDFQNISGELIDDRYKIGSCIGKGTMGSVFEAEHILMKKRVALKMLHPSHTQDPEVVRRFKQEAQAAANIEHPNICSATDFGMYDSETYYLVMELLEGASLADVLAVGVFPPARAIKITKQILSAVEAAHKIGVVHRDLKPENILLIEKNGDPDFAKITDFGIAQVRMEETRHITQVGIVYGSPLYMSPQQAQGEPVDFRTDLYSIGIMLYEMLVGAVPFYAKSLTVVLNMHVHEAPKSFVEMLPNHTIPTELEAIVMQLLSKDPDARFESAMEVYARLTALEEPSEKHGLSEATESTKSPLWLIQHIKFVLPIALLLIAGVVFAIALSITPENKEEEGFVFVPQEIDQNKEVRIDFLKTLDIEFLEELVNKEPKKAIEKIEVLVEKTPNSGHLYYLRGKAYMRLPSYVNGMTAYQLAIENDLSYASDSLMLDDVFKTLESKKRGRSKLAEALILSSIKNEAKERLAELAEHHRSGKVRKRALHLLKTLDELKNLPDWNQLTIELRHAVSCEDNRQLLVKIAALGNPKALAALRRFASNPKNGCKGKDCYECARNDVRIGIEKLESK